MRYGVRQPVNLGPLPCWRLPSYRTPSNSLGYAQWRLGAGATSQHGSSAAGWCGGRCDLLGQAGGASWGLAGLHHRLPVQGLGLGEDGPAACCPRSEEHTSELQSLAYLVCRLLLEKKKKTPTRKLLCHEHVLCNLTNADPLPSH